MSNDEPHIDTSGIDAAIILSCLWNRAIRMPPLPTMDVIRRPMTPTDMRGIINHRSDNEAPPRNPDGSLYVGVLRGRALQVLLERSGFNPRDYDRINGEGVAAEAIADARRITGGSIEPRVKPARVSKEEPKYRDWS